jgi:hypothetical protein
LANRQIFPVILYAPSCPNSPYGNGGDPYLMHKTRIADHTPKKKEETYLKKILKGNKKEKPQRSGRKKDRV